MNALDDNDNGLIDEGCEVRQGPFFAAIAWDESGADVDLEVIGPDGQLALSGRKSGAGLVSSGDCPEADRACPFRPYESVHVDGPEAAPGTYRIRVRLQSSELRAALADRPLEVRLGVRSPEGTRNHLIRFAHVATDVTLHIRVRDPDAEPNPENETDSDEDVQAAFDGKGGV